MSGISSPHYHFYRRFDLLFSGLYWAIDPCHVLRECSFWKGLRAYLHDPDHPEDGKRPFFITFGDCHAYVFFAHRGNGRYPVTDGSKQGTACVDSGLLSLMPDKYVKRTGGESSCAMAVTLHRSAVPSCCDGDLRCGNIQIVTSGAEGSD